MRRSSGFTLIELLVVIGIIADLAAIVILSVNPGRQFAQARNARRQGDAEALYHALQQYQVDKQTLPAGITTKGKEVGTNSGNVDLSGSLAPEYISVVPKDPKTGSGGDTRYMVCHDKNNDPGVAAVDTENDEVVVYGTCINIAGSFNGTSSSITVPDSPSLHVVSTFTIEAWVKNTNGNNFTSSAVISSKRTSLSTVLGWTFLISATNGLSFFSTLQPYPGGQQYATQTCPGQWTGSFLNKWVHVAATINGSSATLFCDGKKLGTTIIAPVQLSTSDLTIGSFPNPLFWSSKGGIDEIRLSDTIRYTNDFIPEQTFVPDSHTRALWRFSEARGKVLIDSSPNSNNGTLKDGTGWVIGNNN